MRLATGSAKVLSVDDTIKLEYDFSFVPKR
jgi:hypothetical protein